MGEARRRGTFEERKAAAIEAGRVKQPRVTRAFSLEEFAAAMPSQLSMGMAHLVGMMTRNRRRA